MPRGHAPFASFNRTANPLITALLSSPADVRLRIQGKDYNGRGEAIGDERSGVTVRVQLVPSAQLAQ